MKDWREEDPLGAVAEIVIVDMFSRFLFRDTKKAYENDALALELAKSAIERKDHLKLDPIF